MNGFLLPQQRWPSPPPPPPASPAVLQPAPDVHVRRGQEEYSHALSGLLPQGIAWPRWPDSTIMQVIYGLAGILGFADNRAADLLEIESDPRKTIELLPDWWRNWQPYPCIAEPTSIAQQHTQLVQWMTIYGAQSAAFFISVAAQIGYGNITISEYRPFMVGIDACGDNRTYDPTTRTYGDWPCQIGSPEMRFAWTMHVGLAPLTWFRCGSGQVGFDPHLRIGYATDLECAVRTWSPAHTQVLFDYSGLTAPGDPMAGTP